MYAVIDLRMDDAVRYVEQMRADTGVRVTLMHVVTHAVASAIAQYPTLNGIVARGRIMLRDTVDAFVQVSLEGGRDLSGVKIVRANEKSPLEIARECEQRIARLRARQDREVERTKSVLDRIPVRLLGPVLRTISFLIYDLDLDLARFGIVKDEFGSVMVTNVGPFGISAAFAPLVPFSRTPVVLLLGEVEPRPVVEDGQIVVRQMMTVGVTFDHRFMDGEKGGQLIKIFREAAENPGAVGCRDSVAGRVVTHPSL